MADANKESQLTTHPQFRQIALVVYIGVFLIGLLDWLSGRPPSTLWEIDPTIRLTIFCVAMSLLILMEIGRQSIFKSHMLVWGRLYLIVTIILGGIVLAISNYFYSQLLFLVTILFSELTFQRRIRAITILTIFMLLFARMAFGPRGDFISSRDLENLAIYILAMLLIMMLARLIKRESSQRQNLEKLNNDLKSSHHQLQASTEQLAEMAVVNERNRLARDIHDGLGHHLAAVNIQLEMGMKLYEQDPEATLKAMEAAKTAAKEALNDVRNSVQTLREADEQFELEPAIKLLIERFQNQEFDIRLKIDGDEADYSQVSRMVLYRAVQEGLTNAHKHASATRVSLWLQFKNEQAHLRIVDNGSGFDAETRTRGMGLQGIRERVAKLGGSFAIDSRKSEGTVLDILIPNSV
ncbi:MAG: sensor histidine kinase [Chloroflexota bacterium]